MVLAYAIFALGAAAFGRKYRIDLWALAAEFARRYPGVRVEPKRFDWGQEAAALRDGNVDVAFVWLPNDLTGLDSEVVAVDRLATPSMSLARPRSLPNFDTSVVYC